MPQKISKKYSLFFVIFLLSFLLVPFFQVGAGDVEEESTSITNPIAAKDFNELVGKIIDWVTNIGISIAIIMIIYAGLLFMTVGGDEEKVTKARKALTWALIGLAVLLIGKGWVYIVQDILGKK